MSGRGAARGSERSAESGRVIHSRCLQRARERRAGRCRRICFDRREPAGRQMVRSTSRPSSIPFYALRIGATMELGRSGRPTMTMSASPGRRRRASAARYLRGHRSTPAKFCSSDMGRLASLVLRCWSGCSARLGTISRIWPRYPFSLPSTRAREASGAMPTDLLRPARAAWAADGEVDVAAVGDSFLRQCWIGATMELGRSGRPTMTMSAAPGRGGGVRSEVPTGPSINDGQILQQ